MCAAYISVVVGLTVARLRASQPSAYSANVTLPAKGSTYVPASFAWSVDVRRCSASTLRSNHRSRL
jgi:hypothetical protein